MNRDAYVAPPILHMAWSIGHTGWVKRVWQKLPSKAVQPIFHEIYDIF